MTEVLKFGKLLVKETSSICSILIQKNFETLHYMYQPTLKKFRTKIKVR